MPLNEREWTREPLPAEQIHPEKGQFLVDDLEDIELVDTGSGFKIERVEHVTLGWLDFFFWLILLLLAR